MDKHLRIGMISMSIWILFLILLFSFYLYITKTPFSYLLDEETGGFISGGFFLVWALIWFCIGKHYSQDYDTKKKIFIKKYQEIDIKYLNAIFKKAYFADIARILSNVSFVAIPFYTAVNIKDTPHLKDYIFVGIFMIFSITTYIYYKKNRIKKDFS